MIGKTISHYKILSKFGEGGMGVVYKTHDLRLDRNVALKFLPAEVKSHEAEKSRFLQEAKAASAVNHPNVCVIHDIQEDEGQQFIVMEYVEGKTLRQILPIAKMHDAITYAIQIGEALQEAHSVGVIHRDIKSENIMVNAKNQIKVMDFGLAKLKGALKLTKASSTVGTLAYMAPEQIQGQEIDARSDIFSFGVVLYEILTGHLPFRGDYEATMVYSIVNEEPEPIQKHLPEISSEMVHILNRALEKKPEERYQTVHDMVIDLRRAKKETSRITRVLITPPMGEGHRGFSDEQKAATAVRRKKPQRTLLLAGIAFALFLIVVIGLLIVLPSHAPQLNPNMTFRILPIPFNNIAGAGLSEDGNWAAFPVRDANKKNNVYYMNTISGELRCVTRDSSIDMYSADISPDGSQIVYDRRNTSTARMEIAIVSTFGGSSKKISDAGYFPQWRPDGQRIGYVRSNFDGSQSGKAEFWTIKPNGSENRRELIDSTSTMGREFSWSPDGRSICWIRKFSEEWRELFIYELSTGKERQVTFDKKWIRDLCWAANDQIVFASNKNGNTNLWMVAASGGTATQVTKGAGPDSWVDISRDGSKLLYAVSQSFHHIWIAGTDGSYTRQITFDDVFLGRVVFSADGKEIVFGVRQPFGLKKGEVVCSIERDGKNRRELTFGEESINNPIPSPDGRWLIYGRHSLSSRVDSSMVYLLNAKNPGTPKLIGKGVPIGWIDEKTYVSFNYSTQSSWLNCIESGGPKKFFEDSTWAIPLQGGKYVSYYDRRSGRQGTWISAAPGAKDPNLPSPMRLASLADYSQLDKSGKFFYYVKNAGELRRISIPMGKEEIVRGVFPGLNPASKFDISYDGKEMVYTDFRSDSKLIMIENVFE